MTEIRNDASIRKAAPADAPALAELRYAFRSALGEAVEDRAMFLRRAEAWMRPRLAPALDGSSWLCFVAVRDGHLVGNVWLQLLEKIPNPVAEPEWHGYVSNFFVLQEARNEGLGAALFAAAIAEARRRGLDRVVLWPTPRSRPFYLRHGFSSPETLLELPLR